jgi:hypothetical protein
MAGEAVNRQSVIMGGAWAGAGIAFNPASGGKPPNSLVDRGCPALSRRNADG